jgi:tetratricopeptide (TPR) repeat protein
MAYVIAQQGDPDRAISLWNQSLVIFEQIGDVKGKATTLWWIATILADRGDFDTAIGYLETSLAIYQRLRDANAPAVAQFLTQVRHRQANP